MNLLLTTVSDGLQDHELCYRGDHSNRDTEYWMEVLDRLDRNESGFLACVVLCLSRDR